MGLIPHPFATEEALCAACGIPRDAQQFDDSAVRPLPAIGTSETLARFELPAQYCGILEYFSQFTDLQAKHPEAIETPDLAWSVLVNQRPLAPFLTFTRILNPWGYGSFRVAVRLDEGARIQMVVRHRGNQLVLPQTGLDSNDLKLVGGRIVGRYWYNPAYGHVSGRGR
jgi:hypothetical protein